MPYSMSLIQMVDQVEPGLKSVLWAILSEIEQHREQSVTREDFHELREIVRDLGDTILALAEVQKRTEQKVEELADAQKRTEQKVEELADAQKRTEQKVEELAEAQKRTEVKVEELAEAQKRTERKVEELADAQKRTEQKIEELTEAQTRTEHSMEQMAIEVGKLSRSLNETRTQVGGLSRSVAYALENEAYRKLPAYLRSHCQIEIIEHLVRTEIGGEEINIFAQASQNGSPVVIVGETVLKLDDSSKMRKLENKINAVKSEFTQPIIPLIITHYARLNILEKAKKHGIIVVQSFEWE